MPAGPNASCAGGAGAGGRCSTVNNQGGRLEAEHVLERGQAAVTEIDEGDRRINEKFDHAENPSAARSHTHAGQELTQPYSWC